MLSVPLLLEAYFFDEMFLRLDLEKFGSGNCETVNLELITQVASKVLRKKTDRDSYQTVLNISIGDAGETNCPYEIRVSIRGFFRILPEVPEEKREPLIENGAFSILYGAAREHIAALTARWPIEPVVLPVVRFPTRNGKQELPGHTAPQNKTAVRKKAARNASKKN